MNLGSIQMLLVVEDNRGDARLFREMFREQGNRRHQAERTWSA